MSVSPRVISAAHREVETWLLERGLDSNQGLSSSAVQSRLLAGGPNDLPTSQAPKAYVLLLRQFLSPMIWLLLAAAGLALMFSEHVDAIVIISVVVLNAVLGFYQDYKAERALFALKKMGAMRVHVLRDEKWQWMDARELVVDDMIEVRAGDVVPADARLYWSSSLSVDESLLTGESLPVMKSVSALGEDVRQVADMENTVFRGCAVTAGQGFAVVTATGSETAMGQIAKLLKETQDKATPTQRKISRFTHQIIYVVLGICAVLLLSTWLQGLSWHVSLMTALSLAVAAVPESLPAVVTFVLALGAQRMAKLRVLVRKLAAVESLGSVTVICTDKTGTLTENRMKLEATWGVPESHKNLFVATLGLCHEIDLNDSDGLRGDPMEVALYRGAVERGWDEVSARKWKILEVKSFRAEARRMSVVVEAQGQRFELFKGAFEAIAHEVNWAKGELDRAISALNELAGQGYRVLAVSALQVGQAQSEFLGLVGLMDPPQEGVREAVAECRAAGIRIIMITGDHQKTAEAIGRQIGLDVDSNFITSGAELEKLPDGELVERLQAPMAIFARIDPTQKLRLVEKLQGIGEVVAMTGDGVNDAPALKTADVGVSMGLRGTEVARDASDISLLQDRFVDIVRVIREGRRINDNLMRFLKLVLGGNLAEVLAVSLAPLFGLPLPLTATQILWVNLITDSLPGLALAVQEEEPDLMSRPPEQHGQGWLNPSVIKEILLVGGGVALATLLSHAAVVLFHHPQSSSVAFGVLIFAQLIYAWHLRGRSAKGRKARLMLLMTVVGLGLVQGLLLGLPELGQWLTKDEGMDSFEFISMLTGLAAVVLALQIAQLRPRSRRGRHGNS